MPDVNIPLLRKCVEWAEAEAMKPDELRNWEQNYYSVEPDQYPIARPIRGVGQVEVQKAPSCGTCYCIAGYASYLSEKVPGSVAGAEVLGLNSSDARVLFDEENTIEDIRRIAESIAGERL